MAHRNYWFSNKKKNLVIFFNMRQFLGLTYSIIAREYFFSDKIQKSTHSHSFFFYKISFRKLSKTWRIFCKTIAAWYVHYMCLPNTGRKEFIFNKTLDRLERMEILRWENDVKYIIMSPLGNVGNLQMKVSIKRLDY